MNTYQQFIPAFDAIAHERSNHAFAPGMFTTRLNEISTHRVFQPDSHDIARELPSILEYVRSGRVKVLIPVREFQENGAPILRETLDVLVSQVGADHVFVCDNGMHPNVAREVRASGVTLIATERIRTLFDWARLSEILNLPQLTFGKGYAVMLGMAYLAREGIMAEDDWLVQCDSDIARFDQYAMIPHLFYPLAHDRTNDCHYLKMAKIGRNNETVHAGINSLVAHFRSPVETGDTTRARQVQVAHEIYDACIEHIWMLSGEFALRWRHALRRMFTTGYCEELFISAQHGWHPVSQTLNPNPRPDRPNTKRKEDCMMIRILQFINALVVFGQSVRQPWDLERITRFNRHISPGLASVVWIPDDTGPLQRDHFEPDRIIPAIETMLETGLLR